MAYPWPHTHNFSRSRFSIPSKLISNDQALSRIQVRMGNKMHVKGGHVSNMKLVVRVIHENNSVQIRLHSRPNAFQPESKMPGYSQVFEKVVSRRLKVPLPRISSNFPNLHINFSRILSDVNVWNGEFHDSYRICRSVRGPSN